MKSFNSKILLFGEYGLLKGSMGLAIPYKNYSGSLVQPDENSILQREQLVSNSIIKKFAVKLLEYNPHLSKKQVNILLEDALLGLYFDSNIPTSYGIGSSGALVAAIYDKYFCCDGQQKIQRPLNLKNLKVELSHMESFFHGNSSGTDPLVSYLNSPLLLNAPINNVELNPSSNFNIFLIDTGKPSSTKEYMQLFDDKLKVSPNLVNTLIQKNNASIIAFLENRKGCFEVIKDFCDFENYFLAEMFCWNEALVKTKEKHGDNLAIKLCGSGGGGFLLGFAKNESLNAILHDFLNENIRFEKVTIPNCKLVKI